MLRMRRIYAVSLLLVGLLHVAKTRPHEEGDEVQNGERHKREAVGYGWKHTEYLISTLKQQINNNDLYFCDGDAFKGIQCPEEPLCVQWHELCDGVQTCGMELREACINSTIDSYGRTDERFCVGDENPKWCSWKRRAPLRCGEDFVISPNKKRQRFRIRSPNFPSNYLTDRYCFWTVSTIPGRTLSVKFMRFNTEPNYDFLSIGQGLRRDYEQSVLLYKHSGHLMPASFKTNRNMGRFNQLWVSFRSDDWDTDKGFVIEVTDNTIFDAPYVASNPLRTPPRRDCGGRVSIPTNGEKTLASPGYPEFYDTHVHCEWIVSARKGRRIEVRFTLFDIEEQEDYLSLGNGPTARRYPIFYHKTGLIRDYGSLRHISSASDVWLMFESSVAIARQGFVANFREVPITECGGTLVVPSNGSIAVASKNYPNLAYSSNMDCTWNIKNEEGRRLWISFTDFSTEWQRDFLSIGNGAVPDRNRSTAVISLHSGTHLPDPYDFMSTGDEVWMTFTTSRYANHRGFLVDIFDEMLNPAPFTTAPPTTPTPATTQPPPTREGKVQRVRVTRRPRPRPKPRPRPGPAVLPGMELAPTYDYVELTTRTTTQRPTTTRRTTTTRQPTTTRRTTTTRRPTTTRRTTTTRRPTTTLRTTSTTRRVVINPWDIPSESSSSSSTSYGSSVGSSSQYV